MRLSGWGRFPIAECNVLCPRTEANLIAALAQVPSLATTIAPAIAPAIARGMGRAYGDSALNTHAIVSMTAFAHMLSFDAHSGVLVAESGVTLADVISVFLPRGSTLSAAMASFAAVHALKTPTFLNGRWAAWG